MRASQLLLVPPLAFSAIAVAAGVMKWRERAHADAAQSYVLQNDLHDHAQGGGLPVLWDAPPFSYPDQDGHRLTDQDLHGRTWIADFIFTQCTSACPLMTARMILLQQQLRTSTVEFVSFSVDPEHDTPAVLKQYAARWHGDETRWRLLSTDDESLQVIASAMRVFVQQTGDKDNPIGHSNVFSLVDQAGKVRGLYDSDDSRSMAVLAQDAAMLAGGEASSVGRVGDQGGSREASGDRLFVALGCPACHTQPRIAPSLSGLAGQPVRLDDGSTTIADAAYLRESIVDPMAKVTAGYNPIMPSYSGYLSDAQVSALADYVASLGGSERNGEGAIAPASAPTLAVDPVCGMKVTVAKDTPSTSYKGRVYYFCSDKCLKAFTKHPGDYVSASAVVPASP